MRELMINVGRDGYGRKGHGRSLQELGSEGGEEKISGRNETMPVISRGKRLKKEG